MVVRFAHGGPKICNNEKKIKSESGVDFVTNRAYVLLQKLGIAKDGRMYEMMQNRIIGWVKKDLLSESELDFCLSVYGDESLSCEQWEELRRINRRNFKKMG